MYEDIAGISITGKYFETQTDLKFFKDTKDRVSIIYGKNGSGKSTIAKAFSVYNDCDITNTIKTSLIRHDGTYIGMKPEREGRMFIFDEAYINDNIIVKSDGLGSIVLFGEQVEIEKQIATIEEVKEKYEATEEEYLLNFIKYQDINNFISPAYHYGKIKAVLRSNQGWAEIDSNIKGNRQNSAVTDGVINEICKITNNKSLNELEKDFKAKQILFKKITTKTDKYLRSIELISIAKDIDIQLIHLLSQSLSKPELTERENLILSAIEGGFQNRVEDAHKHFSDEDVNICPFCYQPISNEYKKNFQESIKKVLNKDVDEHKKKLELSIIDTIKFDVSEFAALDFEQNNKVKIAIESCNDVITKYNLKLEEKLTNVYSPLLISSIDLYACIEKVNFEVQKLEEMRIAFNQASDNKRIIKDSLIELNKQIANIKVKDCYEAYKKQKIEMELEEKNLQQIKENIEAKKIELDDLNQKRKNIKIAVENINLSLEYVFFCKDRLALESNGDSYNLKSYGKPVKPADVSCGERNIIALCYFFIQIMSNLSIKEVYCQEQFLIIDDPVSSFDMENRVGVLSFLKSQMLKIMLGHVNSKIVLLSHDLSAIYDLVKIAEEISNAAKDKFKIKNTNFTLWELKKKCIIGFSYNNRQEYTSLMEIIYNYATEVESSDNEMIIGNVMRRVLEAFSTFEYKKGISEISCNKKILDSLEDKANYFENLMYRLILNGESHIEEQIKSMQDLRFYSSISTEEKKRTAKDILCLIYLLNSNHMDAHLSKIVGACSQIDSWCDDINVPNQMVVAE